METRLFVLQRASAMLLAPLVVCHLAVILYAVRGGLTADEILARTQGSVGWALFYGVFVLAVSLHAPIGVRNVLKEWTRWRGRSLDAAMLALAAVLMATGLRAVWAVVT
ncbi:MAG: succinate dehydrogenase [Gammaproteobacteria bacterium]|nr:succinate dehydrogenase [Gammaproteobacteria bacterium]NIM72377.1 succinate dehydrogenase [Gammaproteobacteria bacterium]NIN40213.1 succinate dehydrogenase [Gammaproteobacteria bacterium]NIO24135.1 succinate dehydrogenase [Gammaproteobacteria bacterium]NIO65623.1 succinate dehydrogenase [Gammaproteobacteria bacterium]